MTDFKAKMHKIISAGAPPQTPLEELTALPRPPSWIWGTLRGRGRGWAGKREGKGREGEVKGRERKGPKIKLLLNQGPSEPCYATDRTFFFPVFCSNCY